MARYLLMVALTLSGCVLAASPVYRPEAVAIGNPQMTAEQALAVCEPQARTAGQRAANEVRARYSGQQNQVTGYRCNVYGGNGSYETDCRAKTAGQSPFSGIVQGQEEGAAMVNAQNGV